MCMGMGVGMGMGGMLHAWPASVRPASRSVAASSWARPVRSMEHAEEAVKSNARKVERKEGPLGERVVARVGEPRAFLPTLIRPRAAVGR